MRRDLIIVAALCAGLIAWLGWQTHSQPPEPSRLSASGLLGGAPGSFRQVTEPRPFAFPDDHAAHPGFRNEWWYFTGHLEGERGPLGFQFTLFRFGLDGVPELESDWRAEAVWMAHLAVSDAANERFLSSERFARGAAGLAGAEPGRWWLRDWQVSATDGGWRLEADGGHIAVELDLDPTRPIVTQGEHGYSRKGPEPGHASHYYSATRLRTRGRVRIDGHWQAVAGLSWLDREWGSSQLGDDLGGWDWFALHLDDGRDVMVYQLRGCDGEASPYSAGSIVGDQGKRRSLDADDFTTRALRRWRDSDGHAWPVVWHMEIPDAGLALEIEPLFDDQLWRGTVTYWEGAVIARDAASGESVGRGYLELSGYADGR